MFRASRCPTCARPLFADEPRWCRVCWLEGWTRWFRVIGREAGTELLLNWMRWKTQTRVSHTQ